MATIFATDTELLAQMLREFERDDRAAHDMVTKGHTRRDRDFHYGRRSAWKDAILLLDAAIRSQSERCPVDIRTLAQIADEIDI
jgi:hypothetical protein